MLEQSALHGRIYLSEQAGKSYVSKPVLLPEIRFGPMRAAFFYPISDQELLVEDPNRGVWYQYCQKGETEGELTLQWTGTKEDCQVSEPGQKFFYYYGLALYQDPRTGESRSHLYFVQNEPPVTYEGIPDTKTIRIPPTLQKLDYIQVFTYPEPVAALLSDVPSAYVDRFKRPVIRRNGRTYPVSMEKVETKWKDLPETTYPKVVDFSRTPYAVADLEPEHTEEDLREFASLPGYYEEETPRGGKHKLLRVDTDQFKVRYSKGLEIINQSQVTLYGIHGTWLCDDPPLADLSPYREIGHGTHAVRAALTRPDVSEEVRLLQRKAEENVSTARVVAERQCRMDPDDSHGEYVALRTLYRCDIHPYAKQFDPERLPWITEAYSRESIPHRDKHETLRNGLPYLVYLAAIIIERE